MAALTEVRIPDIGDASDVSVVEVLVGPGDTVSREDPIVTLESEKASMDVPSPIDGVVEQVHVAVGDEVAEGTLVLSVAVADSTDEADGPTDAPASEPETPDTRKPADGTASSDASDHDQARPDTPAPERVIHASPLARGLARELGVDLAAVTGTSPDGRITKDDVLAYANGATTAAPTTRAGAPAIKTNADPDRSGPGRTETVALSRIRKLAGARLLENWVTIPHVTHHDEADVTELEAFRVGMNDEHAADGPKITMVALLLRACARALQEHPSFNASLDGDTLVLKHYYNIGVAVDTERGLVVPVVRDVERKGLVELAGELKDVSGAARAGKLTPAQLQDGTFTISSLGGIGGTGFTPIINAPEVAILGVARMAMRPVWDGSAFLPRLMLPLSLSYDHRVIDGAAAARFTRTLASILEDMRRVLL